MDGCSQRKSRERMKRVPSLAKLCLLYAHAHIRVPSCKCSAHGIALSVLDSRTSRQQPPAEATSSPRAHRRTLRYPPLVLVLRALRVMGRPAPRSGGARRCLLALFPLRGPGPSIHEGLVPELTVGLPGVLFLPCVRVLTSRFLGSWMDLSSSIPCSVNEKAQTNAYGKLEALLSYKFLFPKLGSRLELHVVTGSLKREQPFPGPCVPLFQKEFNSVSPRSTGHCPHRDTERPGRSVCFSCPHGDTRPPRSDEPTPTRALGLNPLSF